MNIEIDDDDLIATIIDSIEFSDRVRDTIEEYLEDNYDFEKLVEQEIEKAIDQLDLTDSIKECINNLTSDEKIFEDYTETLLENDTFKDKLFEEFSTKITDDVMCIIDKQDYKELVFDEFLEYLKDNGEINSLVLDKVKSINKDYLEDLSNLRRKVIFLEEEIKRISKPKTGFLTWLFS
jgi:hypothetical protein